MSLLFSSIKQFYPILSGVEKDAAKPHTLPAWDAEMIGGYLNSTAGGSACQQNAISQRQGQRGKLRVNALCL